MRELQWRPREEIDARALERLRFLLAPCGRPRAVLSRPLGPSRDDVGRRPRLAGTPRPPVTAKADLRARRLSHPNCRSNNLPAARRRSVLTIRPTGLPFEFFWDRAAADAPLGAHLFSLEWAGVAIWDPRVAICGPLVLRH